MYPVLPICAYLPTSFVSLVNDTTHIQGTGTISVGYRLFAARSCSGRDEPPGEVERLREGLR
jgi:hypothetical protein